MYVHTFLYVCVYVHTYIHVHMCLFGQAIGPAATRRAWVPATALPEQQPLQRVHTDELQNSKLASGVLMTLN